MVTIQLLELSFTSPTLALTEAICAKDTNKNQQELLRQVPKSNLNKTLQSFLAPTTHLHIYFQAKKATPVSQQDVLTQIYLNYGYFSNMTRFDSDVSESKDQLQVILHTIYTRNNMGQKCEGNCGLWVLHEIAYLAGNSQTAPIFFCIFSPYISLII